MGGWGGGLTLGHCGNMLGQVPSLQEVPGVFLQDTPNPHPSDRLLQDLFHSAQRSPGLKPCFG